jgi:hypothetical protein
MDVSKQLVFGRLVEFLETVFTKMGEENEKEFLVSKEYGLQVASI